MDSGADHCVFSAEIGEALGVHVTQGAPIPLTGFVREANVVGFLHRVTLTIAAQSYEAPVVFAPAMTAVGILGQVGFFNHFVATFDWTSDPPCFDIQKIQRN